MRFVEADTSYARSAPENRRSQPSACPGQSSSDELRLSMCIQRSGPGLDVGQVDKEDPSKRPCGSFRGSCHVFAVGPCGLLLALCHPGQSCRSRRNSPPSGRGSTPSRFVHPQHARAIASRLGASRRLRRSLPSIVIERGEIESRKRHAPDPATASLRYLAGAPHPSSIMPGRIQPMLSASPRTPPPLRSQRFSSQSRTSFSLVVSSLAPRRVLAQLPS